MQNAISSGQNSSIIQPAGFYIVALSSVPYSNVYVMFLTVLYVITVICNVFLISIIVYDQRLHVPKFMAVGNLAVVDLILSTSLVPGMIKIYIVLDNFMPFKLCLVQMYTYYTFLKVEALSLCILSYDRFIAICFPLRHESINTNTRMTYIICVSWFLSFSISLYGTLSIPALSFCGSLQVNSYFCDYAPVLRVACSDTASQFNFGTASNILFVIIPFAFIFLTYAGILYAVFRMKNNQSRFKALATCTEHLILVALFFFPIVIIFSLGLFGYIINSNVRSVCLSMTSLLTPCVNPILYSLKTKEIRSRVYFLLPQRLSVHPLKSAQ
ncbi:odorant receptor 108-2 [Danio rerio]|uniref:Olfactory receptor n=1 Tax=Danio rerio TaxID=7955 RepID=Q2PRM3_DANRE|nr:odorant receptor 108-2 [Danio rerio]ABC43244.1 odorant receptor [Danio rerio]|eukprot:NP_001121879.1 odorant receptor, family D, subfamily 108, member 2 [Danio rerio]